MKLVYRPVKSKILVHLVSLTKKASMRKMMVDSRRIGHTIILNSLLKIPTLNIMPEIARPIVKRAQILMAVKPLMKKQHFILSYGRSYL